LWSRTLEKEKDVYACIIKNFNVVERSSEFFLDPERIVCTTRNCACVYVCGTDEENECRASLKKNMPLASAPFFFFFEHAHIYILNKRTMLRKRLMGCGNSLENINGSAQQHN
jgi:hypothetical protein